MFYIHIIVLLAGTNLILDNVVDPLIIETTTKGQDEIHRATLVVFATKVTWLAYIIGGIRTFDRGSFV